MKICFGFLTTLFLMNFTPPSVWREFSSFEGKFRILAPDDMTEKVSKMKTDLGELNYHQYIYKPEDKNAENVFYLVNYCDYPKGSFPQDSTDLINDFLKTTVESSVESVYGKLDYESDIQLFTHKGKIWRVQYNNGKVTIKNKCFLVGDRFYLLQVMTLKERIMNTYADKFLDSFYVF